MANAVYDSFTGRDMDTDSVRIALVHSYTFDRTHETLDDVRAAGGVLNGESGVIGDAVLFGPAFAADATVLRTSASAKPHHLIVHDALGLIAYFDDQPVQPGNGTVEITWQPLADCLAEAG